MLTAHLPSYSGGPDRLTLGAVLRAALARCLTPIPAWQARILRALCACRTPALGGHRYICEQCGAEHFVPHACRNRHCPACQGDAAHQWLARQEACLLPVPYFHLVFTLPHDLNPLIQQNLAPLLNLLFAAVSATLLQFGHQRLGATLGLTVVLHTWGQKLIDHYHLHVLVTGGGLAPEGTRWVPTTRFYLFPVRALSRVFRAKFGEGLQRLFAAGQLQFHGQLAPLALEARFQALIRQATRHPWNVYAKRPFAGPAQVLTYLSRYTHRVALSQRRLQHLDPEHHTVTFTYKDYADHDRVKPLTLSMAEFLRRFRLHLLPPRFVKIRHYGFLSNGQRQHRLAQARALLHAPSPSAEPALTTIHDPPTAPGDHRPRCPHCAADALVLVEILYPPKSLRPEDTS
jgi:hypothetical protein